MPTKEPIKVAVLGGGPAALAAALELTAPSQREHHEVTVYVPGWRLGGKCASGRNLARGARIEEHGLHVWFGYYENSFRLAREVFAELDRPPEHPLSGFDDAFLPCDRIVLHDRAGDGWRQFPVTFPRNGLVPGRGGPEPDFWDASVRLCGWALRRWREVAGSPSQPGSPRADPRGWRARAVRATRRRAVRLAARLADEGALRVALRLARGGRTTGGLPFPPREPAESPRAHGHAGRVGLRARLLALLMSRARDQMWHHLGQRRLAEDARARLFFTTFDTFASAVAGIVADRVLERGWGAIDDRDLCAWLSSHGAKEITVGATPAQRAPVLRALYDLAFAYPSGRIESADAAAGVALSNLVRLLFTYRGAVLYHLRSGMGDTVIAPMYEVLRRRGVRFEYFTAVTDLRVSDGGTLLEGIDVLRRAEPAGPEYAPLVRVRGVDCWPSEPLWEQLRDGARLRDAGVDFEAEAGAGAHPGRARTLTRGEAFDVAVLAIPVGALTPITTQIAARHPRFARMLASAQTVATQAFQLWLTGTPEQLGWRHGRAAVSGTQGQPCDTWADMSHVAEREDWPAGTAVRSVAYFCGVLDGRRGESGAAAAARASANLRGLVQDRLGEIWPGSAAGAGSAAEQYARANTGGSERYVLTPAGTVTSRLRAGESGLQNMVLAGDWTRNGVDGGCVEAAITSGLQAAREVSAMARRRHLAPRAERPAVRRAARPPQREEERTRERKEAVADVH